MSTEEVKQAVARARLAQLEWQDSPFKDRVYLLRTLQVKIFSVS